MGHRSRNLLLTSGAAAATVMVGVFLDALLTGSRIHLSPLDGEDFAPSIMEELRRNHASRPSLMLQTVLSHLASTVHSGGIPQPLMDAEWRKSLDSDNYLAGDGLQDAALHKVELHDIILTDPLNPANRLPFKAIAAHRDERTGFDAIALFEPISHTLLLLFPGLEPKWADYGAVMQTLRRVLPTQNSQVVDFMYDVFSQIQGNRIVRHTHICAHSLGTGAGLMAAALLDTLDAYRQEMGQGSYGVTLIEGWAESMSAGLILKRTPELDEKAFRARIDSVRLYPATFIGTDMDGNKPFGARVTAIMQQQGWKNPVWTFWRENNHRLEYIYDGLSQDTMTLCQGEAVSFESTWWARSVKTFLAVAANVRA